MAKTGSGTTLSGSTLGSVTGVQSISIGGLTLGIAELIELGQTNRIPEGVPTIPRESPLELTVTYAKTIYDTCRDQLIARTEDTFTLTDSESSTHVGAGFVTGVSGPSQEAESVDTFTITLTPKFSWTFTPSV